MGSGVGAGVGVGAAVGAGVAVGSGVSVGIGVLLGESVLPKSVPCGISSVVTLVLRTGCLSRASCRNCGKRNEQSQDNQQVFVFFQKLHNLLPPSGRIYTFWDSVPFR